jgi:uncharacterized protein YbjT (DUF2867 family)
MQKKILVTGATGFIGARLAGDLLQSGYQVRCMVRDRQGPAARLLRRQGCEIREADVLDADSLSGIGDDIDVAYYLIHSMGRGQKPSDLERRERQGARNFARVAKRDGICRVVYLGGLGSNRQSRHLGSRHQAALTLRKFGPPLTYFRAGMVVGARSESYRTLRYLVQRLPAMIAPGWLRNETQPIAIDDAIGFLIAAAHIRTRDPEIQIGGADILSYGDMLDTMAEALGLRRRPRVPVPFVTPWLSSLWIGLVTPVDADIARPLIEGLSAPTVVTDPRPAKKFGVRPVGFEEALQRALADDPDLVG